MDTNTLLLSFSIKILSISPVFVVTYNPILIKLVIEINNIEGKKMKKLIIALLLVFGAAHAMDAPDKNNKALIFAISRGATSLIPIYIRQVTDLNYKDPATGNTALIAAVIKGDLRTVQALIRAGVNTTITNKQGKNALDIALDTNKATIANYLRNLQAPQATPPIPTPAQVQQKKLTEERGKRIAAEEAARKAAEIKEQERKKLALATAAEEKRFAEERAKLEAEEKRLADEKKAKEKVKKTKITPTVPTPATTEPAPTSPGLWVSFLDYIRSSPTVTPPQVTLTEEEKEEPEVTDPDAKEVGLLQEDEKQRIAEEEARKAAIIQRRKEKGKEKKAELPQEIQEKIEAIKSALTSKFSPAIIRDYIQEAKELAQAFNIPEDDLISEIKEAAPELAQLQEIFEARTEAPAARPTTHRKFQPTQYLYYRVPKQADADCGLEALLNTAEILKQKPGGPLVIKTSAKRSAKLKLIKNALEQCNLKTTYVTDDEIIRIVPLVKIEQDKFIVIPNLDKFSPEEYSEDRIKKIIKAIQTLQTASQAKYGFTIGTMSVKEKTGIGGHWISVVVDKQSPGNIIFYVADSMGNPKIYKTIGLIDRLIRILNMSPNEMLMEIEIGPLLTIAEAKNRVGKLELVLYVLANLIAKAEENELWNNAQFIQKYRNEIGRLINFSLEASGKTKININQPAQQVLNNLAHALKMQPNHLKIAYVAEATLETLQEQMQKQQFKEAWQNIQQSIITNNLISNYIFKQNYVTRFSDILRTLINNIQDNATKEKIINALSQLED